MSSTLSVKEQLADLRRRRDFMKEAANLASDIQEDPQAQAALANLAERFEHNYTELLSTVQKEGVASGMQRWRNKLRTDLIDRYGGGCVSCGSVENLMLLDANGQFHYLSVATGKRLRKAGYPKLYSLVCEKCRVNHLSESFYVPGKHEQDQPEPGQEDQREDL